MTIDEFQNILAEQKQSGLSQQAFCDQKSIRISTFGYWMRKVKALKNSSSGFIHVTEGPSVTLELRMGDELSVSLKPGFDERLLLRMINALLS